MANQTPLGRPPVPQQTVRQNPTPLERIKPERPRRIVINLPGYDPIASLKHTQKKYARKREAARRAAQPPDPPVEILEPPQPVTLEPTAFSSPERAASPQDQICFDVNALISTQLPPKPAGAM